MQHNLRFYADFAKICIFMQGVKGTRDRKDTCQLAGKSMAKVKSDGFHDEFPSRIQGPRWLITHSTVPNQNSAKVFTDSKALTMAI